MPMICQHEGYNQCQDIVMHLLYSGQSVSLLRGLIMDCISNIALSYPTPGVRAALEPFTPSPHMSLAALRLHFFLLLNVDSRMRSRLVESRVRAHLPVLDQRKACVLYDQLRDCVVPTWLKDENVSLLDMTESLKDAYLIS